MSQDERKVVKVACKKTEDNSQGFYITYEDAMKKGEKLYVEKPAVQDK